MWADNRTVTSSFQEVAENESKNLQVSVDSLGDTVSLIHDFESVYDSLPPIMTLPAGGPESDEKMAVVAIIHLMAFCRRQLTMGCLTLMRAQQGDSLLHLRRAIECCAFAVRIWKHNELARVWLNAVDGGEAYKTFRKAFGPGKIFPKPEDPDYERLLDELYERYDRCSMKAHPNVYGMGGHFDYGDSTEKFSFSLNFFDLPPDHSLISGIYLMFDSHKRMLRLFGRMLERYAGDRMQKWRNDYGYVDAKLDVHREQWKMVVPDPGYK
jgi:hypothetical protein